ncbi:MAG: hypothetical protein ACLFQ9_04040 [Desulfobacterales bacterium]
MKQTGQTFSARGIHAMEIKQILIAEIDNFSCTVSDPASNKCAVIDPVTRK